MAAPDALARAAINRLTRVWPAVLCALVGASCSGIAAANGGSYAVATASPESAVLSIFDGRSEAQLNADGTVCAFVVRGKSRTAIIWPTGYTGRGTPLAVYDPAGSRIFLEGKQISLSGGLVLSSRARKAKGCMGFDQSVAYVPTPKPLIATPGSELFSSLQVGEMQRIVTGHPDVFGGLWGDPPSHIVTISVAPEADPTSVAAAKAALLGVGAPAGQMANPSVESWRVGFITAGPSLSALNAVLGQVTSAQPWRRDTGGNLMSWGIDPQRHVVSVGVKEITPVISADAQAAFGSLVLLETADPVTLH